MVNDDKLQTAPQKFIFKFVFQYPIKTKSQGQTIGRLTINYYRPQRSCEGYVFTPVCPSTGGGICLSACWDTTPLGADTPLQADGYYCGRYASYWNAFIISRYLCELPTWKVFQGNLALHPGFSSNICSNVTFTVY